MGRGPTRKKKNRKKPSKKDEGRRRGDSSPETGTSSPGVGTVSSDSSRGRDKTESNGKKLENFALGVMQALLNVMRGVKSNDPELQLECTAIYRTLLGKKNLNIIQQVIDIGVMQRFVDFLKQHDHPSLQYQAACALTSITGGKSEYTEAVVEAGAVPSLVNLLESSNPDVSEQAVWVLGNIVCDRLKFRDLVLNAGVMEPLLRHYTPNSKPSMIKNSSWVLMNLCGGRPKADFELLKPALPILANLIKGEDHETVWQACWTLANLSSGTDEITQAIIDTNVLPRVVELLQDPSPTLQKPALRLIGNVASGGESQTQSVLDNGAIPKLLCLLWSSKRFIVVDTCWALSNIAGGTPKQIQAMFDESCIVKLIELAISDQMGVQKEAAWVVSNAATCGDDNQVHFLIEKGCINPLCYLLDSGDTMFLGRALRALGNIFRVGGEKDTTTEKPMTKQVEEAEGLIKIEKLQYHDNEDVSICATEIMERYFRSDQENSATEIQSFAEPRRPSYLSFKRGYDETTGPEPRSE